VCVCESEIHSHMHVHPPTSLARCAHDVCVFCKRAGSMPSRTYAHARMLNLPCLIRDSSLSAMCIHICTHIFRMGVRYKANAREPRAFHTSSRIRHVSHNMPQTSCLMSHVSYLISHIPYIMSRTPWYMSHSNTYVYIYIHIYSLGTWCMEYGI